MEHFFNSLEQDRQSVRRPIPSTEEAGKLIDALLAFLFPVISTDNRPVAVQFEHLHRQMLRLIHPLADELADKPLQITNQFFEQLPQVRAALLEDAEAFLQFDPAATCIEEVVSTYPGFYAVSVYRLAHVLYGLKMPLLPRVWTEFSHSRTGIDIHPGASIGRSFFIDHGTGVVIGATTLIGDFVKIYQGVTLGALQVDKSLANVKRHPSIGDRCILYANCTILGGKTEIGHDTIVGGNCWITESVPPNSLVMHQAQVKVRQRPWDEPINFVI